MNMYISLLSKIVPPFLFEEIKEKIIYMGLIKSRRGTNFDKQREHTFYKI